MRNHTPLRLSKFFIPLALLPMLAIMVLCLMLLADIRHLQQPKDMPDNSPVRALDFASNLQLTFTQMDIALTRFYVDDDISIETQEAMDEYYQFFDDYFQLTTEHHISVQTSEILQEMQIELAQWIRVRDKIFQGTADTISIALISKRIQDLLARLVDFETRTAYQHQAEIAENIQQIQPVYIWLIFGSVWLIIIILIIPPALKM